MLRREPGTFFAFDNTVTTTLIRGVLFAAVPTGAHITFLWVGNVVNETFVFFHVVFLSCRWILPRGAPGFTLRRCASELPYGRFCRVITATFLLEAQDDTGTRNERP